MRILVTGGTGYIGSHTCTELLNNNHEIIIVDNLINSKESVVSSIEKLTGKKVKFYNSDLTKKEELKPIFEENKIDAVIHFAGLKAVGESVKNPIEYYRNNLISTISLLECMKEHEVKKIVFSSSATVYGSPERIPVDEECKVGETSNPYGTTKFMIEQILKDVYVSDPTWSITILRYFNPIGAHESGLIGESPNGIPNNLMPYILKVANGTLPHLNVFGDDYDTPDGTGVRDYIHVVDLAKGHVKAIDKKSNISGVHIYNLGTGHGYSVLDIIKTFEKENDMKLNYKIAPRRDGDLASYYANPNKAKKELGWIAEKTIADMCRDSWNFMKQN